LHLVAVVNLSFASADVISKSITPGNVSKEKLIWYWLSVYDYNQQKRHNHDRSSQELAANKSVGPAIPLIKTAQSIFSKMLNRRSLK